MTPKDYKEFGLYSKDFGISSLNLHNYNRRIENSLTPYILEERSLNVTVMDVFSRLMMERIIWVAGPTFSVLTCGPTDAAHLVIVVRSGASSATAMGPRVISTPAD